MESKLVATLAKLYFGTWLLGALLITVAVFTPYDIIALVLGAIMTIIVAIITLLIWFLR